jgi:hypothetical protein
VVTYKIRSKKARRDSGNAIAATEAAKTFGRLVNRVREQQATYVIERGGTPVAQIGPVDTKDSTVRSLVDAMRSSKSAFDDEYVRRVKKGIRALNKPAVPKNPWGR